MKALVSIITVNYNGLRDTCEMIDSFRNHETIRTTRSSLWITVRACPKRKKYRNDTGVTSYRTAPYQAACIGQPRLLSSCQSGAEHQQRICRRQQCRTESRRRRLSLFHQQRHPHQRTGTGCVGTTHGVQPATQRRRIAHVEIHRLSGHPAICRLHSSKFPYTAQRIHRIPCNRTARASVLPCETASLHGAAMMVSRQALQDAGPMTEIYFLFYEELDLVCTA